MQIRNQQEADQTLLKIGRLQRDIESEEILLNDSIEQTKRIAATKIGPMQDELKSAENVLLEWIDDGKKALFSGTAKSIELTFGGIGVRDSQSVPRAMPGHSEEEIAKALLKHGFTDCVNVSYKWIRNAVKAIDETMSPKLERCFIRFTRVKKDQPYYTINKAKISDNAGGS